MSGKKIIRNLGIAMAAGLVLTAPGCKSPSSPLTKITLTLFYRNATEGEIWQETLAQIDSGTPVTISFNKISGKPKSNVDPNRITVRDSINNIGGLITHVNFGQATFNAPSHDATYAVYFYSQSNGADYSIIDADSFRTAGSQLVIGTRYMKVRREDRDGQTCPEGVWFGNISGYRGALEQIGEAAQGIYGFDWAKINQVSSGGDFGVGAGNCEGMDGQHLPSTEWAGVNYNGIGDDPPYLVSVALAEGFELICDVDNIGGQPSGMRIQYRGNLLPIGKDYLLYTLIKDALGDK